ncbi:creatininase family protein [Kineococcus sp. NUM-3379]
MELLTTATSADERERAADIAVLPVGSFEQHGSHLPLITDTVIACTIAKALSEAYGLFLLPPLTVSCSHEHAHFPGTVSISPSTLVAIIDDLFASLEQQAIRKLVLVNGHGGNYVLSNIAQQANIEGPRIILYPSGTDWDAARLAAGCETNAHEDMHGGEGETSVLLKYAPSLVRDDWEKADWPAPDRPDLLLLGMSAYTDTGVIGKPSLATESKGEALVLALVKSFGPRLAVFDSRPQ